MDELFQQLLPAEFRSGSGTTVQFPIVSMRVRLRQDLAEHRFWGKDGARVEATGRSPLHVSARIPFRNGIVPGKSESWGVLYPTAFRQFLLAMSDRATGTLVHPELGEIRVKPEEVSFDHTADRRDGVDVDASWVETVDDDLDAVNLYDESPVATATIAATDLDAQLGKLSPPPPSLPAFEPNLGDLMRSIQGVGDQFALSRSKASAKVASLLYRADAIRDSVARAASLTPGERALRWTVVQATERIKSDIRASVDAVVGDGRTVKLYTVPKSTTFAGVVKDVGGRFSDIARLNAPLLGRPVIERGTVVRHYG